MNLHKLIRKATARISGTKKVFTFDGYSQEQQFLLAPPSGGWRGWVKIRIVHDVPRNEPGYSYFLALKANGGPVVKLPVFPNTRGIILEVMRISSDTHSVALIVHHQGPKSQASNLKIKVSYLPRDEAVWRVGLRHRKQLVNRTGVLGGLSLIKLLLKRKSSFKARLIYHDWIYRYDKLHPGEEKRISEFLSELKVSPKFSIIVPVYNTSPNVFREMIASVENQIYQNWELCLADDASAQPHIRELLENLSDSKGRIKVIFRKENGGICAATNSALELASGDFAVFLDHDDVLASHALATVAAYIGKYPLSDVFYSDEDKLDSAGFRYDHFFKPDWSQERLYSQNYLNHLTVIRTSLVKSLGGLRAGFEGSQDYDLVLRACRSTKEPIIHVPHILYHWRIYENATTFSSLYLDRATRSARLAIRECFAASGKSVAVIDAVGSFHRVVRSDPSRWPKVSVIIPTRDCAGILETCLRGLYQTEYPDIEIIVADNGSVEPETAAVFDEARRFGVKVVDCAGPFNYSRINNRAARYATGEILLLLNNDIEIIEPAWLKEMVRYLLEPDIGAVGAKLLYPNHQVQHAGVVLGMGGVAGHMSVFASENAPGYGGALGIARDVSCVTAACMAIKKDVFDSFNGFNENDLKVAFNDVDFCIRLREAGYRIIFTPFAVLFHHESKSRGEDISGEKFLRFQSEVKYMQNRWRDVLYCDPFYHPSLSLEGCNVDLAFPPRITFPWRS